MKKIILTLALFAGTAVAIHAQNPAAGTVTQQKPKAIVTPAAVSVTAPATTDTAVSKSPVKKQAVKRSCCKKEGMPCGSKGSAQPKSSATKQD